MTTPTPHGAPELPEITDDDRQFLHYNPNTDDLVEFVQNYARAAIQQAAGAVPEGWKLVPVEPTPEMIAAGHVGDALGCDVDAKDAKAVYGGAYSAMLAASPSPLGREAGKEGSSDHLVPCAGGGVTQPLTDRQIDDIHLMLWARSDATLTDFARAIEAAHGITAPAPRPDAPTGQINHGSAPREDGHG